MYAAVFIVCDQASRRAAATSLSFSEMLQRKVSAPGSTEMIIIQNSAAGARRIFFRKKRETSSTQAKRWQAFRVRLTAAAGFLQQLPFSPFPPSLPPGPPSHSPPGSIYQRRCARYCRSVQSSIAKDSSDEDDDAQPDQITGDGSESEDDTRPPPKKKEKMSTRNQKKAVVGLSALEEQSQAASASLCDAPEKYGFCKRLFAVPLPDLMSYLQSLGPDSSSES